MTAQRLDQARASIEPSLGASTYTINAASIKAQPGGENQPFNQVVLQLPGVVQDSFGQFHVRDDHNGIQYRINGTILPEGIAVFGQTLSTRLIDSVSLITGALPAQYGLQTAGIIDVTTKTGLANGGEVTAYGGSHGDYEPSFEYGGHSGNTNFYVSGEYRRTQLGIESPDGSSTPDHDRADQGNVFVYLDHILSPQDRVSFIGSYANDRFQIPNITNGEPGNGFTVGGDSGFPTQLLNESQREVTGFALASYLHDGGRYTIQTSVFSRLSTLSFEPSGVGDILFTGISQGAFKRDVALGRAERGGLQAHPRPYAARRRHHPGRAEQQLDQQSGPAGRRRRHGRHGPRDHHRRPVQEPVHLQHLSAGRVAHPAQPYPELRPSRRRPEQLSRREAALAPRQPALAAAAGHHPARGLCALLQPAALRADRQRNRVQVPGHHGRLRGDGRYDAVCRAAELL